MIRASLLDKEVEKLDDHGCPNVQDLDDDKMWISASYPFRNKTTLHCAESPAEFFRNWILHLSKL